LGVNTFIVYSILYTTRGYFLWVLLYNQYWNLKLWNIFFSRDGHRNRTTSRIFPGWIGENRNRKKPELFNRNRPGILRLNRKKPPGFSGSPVPVEPEIRVPIPVFQWFWVFLTLKLGAGIFYFVSQFWFLRRKNIALKTNSGVKNKILDKKRTKIILPSRLE